MKTGRFLKMAVRFQLKISKILLLAREKRNFASMNFLLKTTGGTLGRLLIGSDVKFAQQIQGSYRFEQDILAPTFYHPVKRVQAQISPKIKIKTNLTSSLQKAARFSILISIQSSSRQDSQKNMINATFQDIFLIQRHIKN